MQVDQLAGNEQAWLLILRKQCMVKKSFPVVCVATIGSVSKDLVFLGITQVQQMWLCALRSCQNFTHMTQGLG